AYSTPVPITSPVTWTITTWECHLFIFKHIIRSPTVFQGGSINSNRFKCRTRTSLRLDRIVIITCIVISSPHHRYDATGLWVKHDHTSLHPFFARASSGKQTIVIKRTVHRSLSLRV